MIDTTSENIDSCSGICCVFGSKITLSSGRGGGFRGGRGGGGGFGGGGFRGKSCDKSISVNPMNHL